MTKQARTAGDSACVPVEAAEIDRVDIYYALSNNWPMGRFWRTVADIRAARRRWTGAAPFIDAGDVIYAFANVTYRDGIRISSRLVTRPVAELPGAKPTLARQSLIDAMATATDWNWVPAYTDPNQGDTAFFAPWQGADGERSFTLDPKMFDRRRPMSFYFGTRKIGDPQFRGGEHRALEIDCLAANLPTKLTIRLRHRVPGQPHQEFAADVLPAADEPAPGAAAGVPTWRTIRCERSQFRSVQDVPLPDWEHVEYFMVDGKNPAEHPPVFRWLRWEP